jgi:hypothetical protein
MSKIVNLTPHAVQILAEDTTGELVGSVGFGRAARQAQFRQLAELPSVGVARATTTVEQAGTVEVGGHIVPVTKTVFGGVQDLPEPDGETTFVVSLITASAAQAGGRTTDDLLIVGEAVRDSGGQILGVTGFGRV